MKTELKDPEPMAVRVGLHPLLAGMTQHQLVLLTDCALPARFEKGQMIFRQGEPATRVYLIETGKVDIESPGDLGDPVIVDTIGAGDLLGWSWMFPPYAWQFTARAVEPTSAIFFAGTILRKYCEKDAVLGYELLKRMTVVMNRRMQAARNKMVEVHQGNTALEPVVLEPPFMDQELDS